MFLVRPTLPPVRQFFKYFGSHDRESERGTQRRKANRQCLSFGIIREFHLPLRREKVTNCRVLMAGALRQIPWGTTPASTGDASGAPSRLSSGSSHTIIPHRLGVLPEPEEAEETP